MLLLFTTVIVSSITKSKNFVSFVAFSISIVWTTDPFSIIFVKVKLSYAYSNNFLESTYLALSPSFVVPPFKTTAMNSKPSLEAAPIKQFPAFEV